MTKADLPKPLIVPQVWDRLPVALTVVLIACHFTEIPHLGLERNKKNDTMCKDDLL